MKAQARLPQVKGLVENSLIEWPGKISSVIFLAGCNFRCPFCHSKGLVFDGQEQESIPFESIRELLNQRGDWIDGAVVSGGEPTIIAGLEELLVELKALGMATRINSNGSRPAVLKDLAGKGLIDSVAMDVKGPLDERYSRMAGVEVDLDAIGETIDWLRAGGVGEVEFRSTVVPKLMTTEDIIEIAQRLGDDADYVLQPFRPLDCLDPACSELPATSRDYLVEVAGLARPYVRTCVVRGEEGEASPDHTK